MLNGKVIHVSEATHTEEALIVTGFPYGEVKNTDEFIETIKYFMAQSHGVRRLGSAATDLSYVAAGRFEAFWEVGLSPWDGIHREWQEQSFWSAVRVEMEAEAHRRCSSLGTVELKNRTVHRIE